MTRGWLFAAVLLSTSALAQEAGGKWAVVVGIDEYDFGLKPLAGAVNDASAVAAALVESAGFPRNQVFLLTSDQAKDPARPLPGTACGPPRRANLLHTFAALAEPGKLGAADTVLLFFAGYHLTADGQPCLVAQDTVPTAHLTVDTSLPVSRVSRLLAQLPARTVVALIETYPLEGGLPQEMVDALTMSAPLPGQIRVSGFACQVGQQPRALVTPEGAAHGLFGHYLAQAFRGAASRNGRISLASLVGYLAEAVPASSTTPGLPVQQPLFLLGGTDNQAADRVVLAEIQQATPQGNPRVELRTNKGTITLELQPEQAPATVANFLKLVEAGFYDGTRFHRYVPNFVIQGGDPNSKDDDPANDGLGGPGWTIKLEIPSALKHLRGAVGMARAADPDSAGSQFYITLRETPHLDGNYCVFGQVVSGMEVVEQLRQGDLLESARRVR